MHYKKQSFLTKTGILILLALSLRPRHGYEIIKQVQEDTNGKVTLGVGSLYGTIKHLLDNGYVTEVESAANTRRRYYDLTESGRKILNFELANMSHTLEIAKARNLLTESVSR